MVAFWLSFVARLLLSWRRASIVRRQQLKWLLTETVAVFAARLKNAVDLDAVRDDLASVVHQALEPAHVSLWIRQRN